ncbi:MAG TPA: LacI family DNA-binding transcriptional regulator [Chloroflexia bacterium]|nr:LacI family DNA-binding transcriptional regulator [Chloroflexia bacterium]
MRIKLRDVAQRANVSVATVSRVINGSTEVNERTRQEVLGILNQLGYPLPQTGQTQLDTGSAREIMVVTRGVESRTISNNGSNEAEHGDLFNTDFDPLVIDGIEVILRRLGLPMQIKRIRVENPSEEDLTQLKQARGLILVGGITGHKLIAELEKAQVPFVLAGAHLGDKEANCVLGDYLRSCSQAIKYLALELGHSKIALINGPHSTTTSQDKLEGYRLGLSEAGLDYDDNLVMTAGEFDHYSGYKATQALLERNRYFSAVLYASDQLVVGGLRALKEARLSVPKDVSIIGFYNGAIAQFTDPPLSTVSLDRRRLGAIAAQRLVSMLEYQDFERLRVVIPLQLIMRASTGPYIRD